MGIFNRIFSNSKKAEELSTLNKSLSNVCPHCGEKGYINEVNDRLWCEWCASWIDRENNMATNSPLPLKSQRVPTQPTTSTVKPTETNPQRQAVTRQSVLIAIPK